MLQLRRKKPRLLCYVAWHADCWGCECLQIVTYLHGQIFGLKAMQFEYFLFLPSTIGPQKSYRRDGGYADSLILCYHVAASM